MRLLPDRPSIEYLRKEAKDLLAALRESKPDASLAEAQRALAAEYGVRDWPALKAEVERRVADTPTAPAGLAEELAEAFDLGTVAGPAKPVSFTAMEWDFAGPLSPELELGSVLTHWLMRPEVNQRGLFAFRDGYGEVREWPKLGLDSFAVAITGWLNWTYNSICEAISPEDADHAVFAEREAVGVLDRPMTRGGLEQLLVV